MSKMNEGKWFKALCLGGVVCLAFGLLGQTSAFWEAGLQAKGTITLWKDKMADEAVQDENPVGGDTGQKNDKNKPDGPEIIKNDGTSTETPVVLPDNNEGQPGGIEIIKDNTDEGNKDGNNSPNQESETKDETPNSNGKDETPDSNRKDETPNSEVNVKKPDTDSNSEPSDQSAKEESAETNSKDNAPDSSGRDNSTGQNVNSN